MPRWRRPGRLRPPGRYGTTHSPERTARVRQMRDLDARVGDRPHADREALIGGLDRVDDVLTDSVAPGRFGRGWAVFIGLGDGETRSYAFQLPTETRVVLGEAAFLWPAVV